MKRKNATQFGKGLLLVLCILYSALTNAKGTQTVFKARYAPLAVTDYLLTLQNITQPTDRTIEFDVYLLDTDPTQNFELSSAQLGIMFNSGITTGTLTVIMNNTGSGLAATAQEFPSTQILSAVNGYPNQGILKVSGKAAAIGAGAIILKTGNLINPLGTYLSHFTIVSSTPWVPNTTANLTFNSDLVIPPLYATRVNAVIATVATQLSVTPGVTAVVTSNAVLNPTPTAVAVTGTGSYCQNSGGLPVGLAGSETGATYTLYNINNIAVGTPVAGTGAAITFGNQLAGTYTVKGTNVNGTTVMTGSAVLTETLSVAATVSIAASQNPVNANIAVTFTATPTGEGTTPTYQWYSGANPVGTNSNIYTDNAPTNGEVITVVMTSNAPCVTGSPVTSNAVTMSVSVGTSLDPLKMKVDVYSRDKNILVTCSQKAKQVTVYNSLGSMIMMENNVIGLKTFNMHNYPNEYYFVKIVTDNEVYTQKVLLK